MSADDTHNETITAVFITYNGDNNTYLEEALDSISNQTYQDVETIIVVNGYIDKKKKTIIEEFNSKTPKSQIIYCKENLGPSHARNVGIVAAAGRFIAIADSDDINHNSRLDAQRSFLLENNFDIISSQMEIIDDSKEIVGERALPCSHQKIVKLAPFACPLNNPAVFAKADILKDNRYDTKFNISEDYNLWITLLLKGYKLGNHPGFLVQYRQPANTLAKRVGFKYAKSDLLVKIKALKLVPIYKWPFAFTVAIITAIIRVMPLILFKRLYMFKSAIFKSSYKNSKA